MKQIVYPILIETERTAIAANGSLVKRKQLQLDHDVKIVGVEFSPSGKSNNLFPKWAFSLKHIETGKSIIEDFACGGLQVPFMFKQFGMAEPYFQFGSNLEATFTDLSGAGVPATVTLQALLIGVQNVAA